MDYRAGHVAIWSLRSQTFHQLEAIAKRVEDVEAAKVVEGGVWPGDDAGAVVNQNVVPYALMVGVPARQAGWMSAHGARLDLPLTGDGEAACPESGKRYILKNGNVSPVEP